MKIQLHLPPYLVHNGRNEVHKAPPVKDSEPLNWCRFAGVTLPQLENEFEEIMYRTIVPIDKEFTDLESYLLQVQR